ncbi:MAG: BMP family ABC transporter substrate-binding protein [Clostridiales Family XIII bacterium]|jgi:basic membrane protein A|nr:BMP family ABC transporter substrate-binding protein [Clostridiales Family XIII bacterium]
MKKKLLSVLLVAVMAVSMAACAQNADSEKTADEGDKAAASDGYELALITDVGTIDDKSFNQGSWEGLEEYAKEYDITHKYYKPTEKSSEACLTAIDLAVKGGAKVIVTPGFLFEEPIYDAQTKYPDVTFLLLDGAPHQGDYNYDIKSNTSSVFYAEEQAGYLAGYAAVVEGYTQLGFMGGIAVPAVIRFGYGFIQGADQAAKDLSVTGVNVKYTYVGNFDASPENMAKAASWYNEGTEIIFACGGGVGNSVMKAAETAGTKVIGVDVDQSAESETVITSATKNLGKTVYDTLASYYDNTFEGGKITTLTAKEGGVQLPMENSRFTKFDQATYDTIYAGLADGSTKVENDTIGDDATKVPTEIVTVELIQ